MTAQPEEIFDVVDLTDRVVGQAPRSMVHSQHLLHRAVHVLLFDPAGSLLVQKRSATKDSYPNCYDSSASGHLNSGEDYDAAADRETQEELGLVIPPGTLQKQFKIAACPDTGWEFVWIYTGMGRVELVVPDPKEVVSVTAMTRAQVEALVTTQPANCARAFRRIIAEIIARDLFPIRQ